MEAVKFVKMYFKLARVTARKNDRYTYKTVSAASNIVTSENITRVYTVRIGTLKLASSN